MEHRLLPCLLRNKGIHNSMFLAFSPLERSWIVILDKCIVGTVKENVWKFSVVFLDIPFVCSFIESRLSIEECPVLYSLV